MSSANNKEYGELEQSMWRRFQDAEAMPDPDVWSRIEHTLVIQENAKYKKRLLFYRQLAAACFVLFILAGSALLMHFKQDQEHATLATAQREQTTINEADLPVTMPAQEQTIAAATPAKVPAQPEVTPSAVETIVSDELIYNAHPADEVKSQEPTYSLGNTIAANSTATIDAPQTTDMGTIAGSTKSSSTVIGGYPETAKGTIARQENYMPASQAIAAVPDSYTSPSAINPLLRRNATLGTYDTDKLATDNVNKPEVALALNTPGADNKQEKTAGSNSRWNLGMAYGSSYFDQNIAIPGYTITPPRIMIVPDPTVARQPPGPSISAESEENMRDARIEFEENTQAAMSFNVDVRTGFRIGKRLKLLSGLGYSQNSSKTKTNYIVEQFIFKPRTNERSKLQPTTVFLPSLHTFTTDSISVTKTKEPFDVDYSYQMLSIPVGLQVEGNLSQKWYWYAMGSTAVNFLMQTAIKAANPEISDVTYRFTDDSPFRRVHFSGNVGLGLGARISDAVSISFGPVFRTFFNSMLTDDNAVATQGRPYTIGLNMGINYKLDQ
ncbi:hypothetical protein [Pontibacter burrus]|uniref:Outer membrane protein beta-barrel domain-containing protein n=1 Tax=Pontibacter burrus TaxID=2704466 RepID=A0A6B3LL81_9BACT|nr:hypothetical protein [Pontibacter burrus]NEM96723.1 hypothetical protein [Pontibacter burrus]